MIKDLDQAKQILIKTLDDLQPEQVVQVLDFATFLHERAHGTEPQPSHRVQLRLVPMSSLVALTGVVSLGGDALADSESVYDENAHSH